MNTCPCGEAFTIIGGTIKECIRCFCRNNAEHNVSTLILMAALGIMREPICGGAR